MHRLLRSLVIEDDPAVAMEIEGILQSLGAQQVFIASTESEGQAILRDNGGIGFATVDVQLVGGNSVALAEELDRRGIPFLIISGGRSNAFPGPLQLRPMIQKPVTAQQVLTAIRAVLA